MTSDMKIDYWEMMEYAKNIKAPISPMGLLLAWGLLGQLLEDKNAKMIDNVKKINSERELSKWRGGRRE